MNKPCARCGEHKSCVPGEACPYYELPDPSPTGAAVLYYGAIIGLVLIILVYVVWI